MNYCARLSTILLLIPGALIAQDDATQGNPFAAATQVKKFDRLLGNWEASGVKKATAESPATPWTATGSCEAILGGHWIREIVNIDLGPGVPAPLVLKSFYGWDKESQKFMCYSVSNLGKTEASELNWEDDDTLIYAKTQVEQGQRIVERWQWKFTKTGYEILGHRAVGSGPFFEHVKGTFKRAAKVRGKVLDASVALGPVAPAMSKLKGMIGTYKMKGEMIPAPGAPTMKIAATEVVSFTMGGGILEFKVDGVPDPAMGNFAYLGWGSYSWNEQNKCYDILWLNNMGQGGIGEARSGDNKLIITQSHMMGGQPVVERMIVHLADDGTVKSAVGHSITGDADPVISFKGTWTKQ